MLNRLLPRQVDNRFGGHRAALWLLGLLIFVKLAMSLNSIFNTESVAAGADGIPLASFGPAAAREVLLLFALVALGHLTITLIALAALIRWRALVPFLYLVSLAELIARRFIVESNALERAASSPVAWYVTWGVMGLVTLGLALSLLPGRTAKRS